IPQACCHAHRCQRSDRAAGTSRSGISAYLLGCRTRWAINQSTYACTTHWYSAASLLSFCSLPRLARCSVRWVIAFFTVVQLRFCTLLGFNFAAVGSGDLHEERIGISNTLIKSSVSDAELCRFPMPFQGSRGRTLAGLQSGGRVSR